MLILNGQHVTTYGITTKSWLDNPAWRLTTEDRHARRTAIGHSRPEIQMIVAHTTMGKVGPIIAGKGPFIDPATKTLKHWATDDSPSATQLWIGPDGTVFQVADLAEECPHAGNGNVNRLSVGFEMYQLPRKTDGTQEYLLYQAQLEATASLIDNLTRILNIKRQYQWPYLGHPPKMLARPEEGGEGGQRFVGVCGHRDASRDRGRGDPGDALFQVLGRRGYEARNFDVNPDLTTYAQRQAGRNVVGGGLLGAAGGWGLALTAGALWLWFKRKR